MGVVVAQAALVAAQLLVDLLDRIVEGDMGVMRAALRLQDQALHHVGDDIAPECTLRGLAEGNLRGERAARQDRPQRHQYRPIVVSSLIFFRSKFQQLVITGQSEEKDTSVG